MTGGGTQTLILLQTLEASENLYLTSLTDVVGFGNARRLRSYKDIISTDNGFVTTDAKLATDDAANSVFTVTNLGPQGDFEISKDTASASTTLATNAVFNSVDVKVGVLDLNGRPSRVPSLYKGGNTCWKWNNDW